MDTSARGQLGWGNYARELISHERGIVAWLRDGSPITEIRIAVRAGTAHDQSGGALAAVLGKLLTSATKDRDPESTRRDFRRAGGTVSVGVDEDYIVIGGACLSPMTQEFLELTLNTLDEPLFEPEQVRRSIELCIQDARSAQRSGGYLARQITQRMLFAGHPYSHFATEDALERVTSKDLLVYWRNHFRPETTMFVLVGNFDVEIPFRMIRKWRHKGLTQEVLMLPAPDLKRYQRVSEERPQSLQETIRVSAPTAGLLHEDFPATEVVRVIMGGSASSRLLTRFKEQKGWCYHVSAGIRHNHAASTFSIGGDFLNGTSERVLEAIFAELKAIREKQIQRSEFDDAIAYIQGAIDRSHRTHRSAMSWLLPIVAAQPQGERWSDYTSGFHQVSPQKVLSVANKYFQIENFSIAVIQPPK